jgi:hypothetical protein
MLTPEIFPESQMTSTARRLALVAAAALTTVLAACSNPTAPGAAKKAPGMQQPNADGVYSGSFG